MTTTDITPEPLTQTDILLAVAWKATQPGEWNADDEDGGAEFVEMLTQAASILSLEPTNPDETSYRLASAVAAFVYAVDGDVDLRDVYDEWQAHLGLLGEVTA